MSNCVEIILRLTTQGVPDITTFTEGEGLSVCVCVFVFRQVSAHMHEYAASSYVYWSSGDIPLLLFSVCLFVCVSDSFTIVTLFPADSAGKHATSISCHPGSITRAECVWIHIQQRTGQCKCKHQPTHQNKGAQYASLCQSPYTCSICPLFWLESPLGHIMAASSALSSFLPLTGKGLFVGRYKHDSCLRAFLAP